MKPEQINKQPSSDVKRRYPGWFYAVLILFPILFIIVLELILRTADYGKDYEPFIKVSDQLDDYLFFNPEVVQKFFSDKSVIPSVIPDGFKKQKENGTFRIFVLGGSSAAGYPYPTNASFSRQLKRRLQLVYPDKNFEVINLGVSAVNSVFMSYVIDDVLRQSPDLILIYAGHNEYYGAYGAAFSSPLNISPSIMLKIKDFKVYQLVENFLGLFEQDQSESGRTLMAEMAGDNLVPLDSEAYRKGIESFRDNLDHILLRCSGTGVPVILGTVTSNIMQRPLDAVINPESAAVKLYDKGIREIDTNFTAGEKLLIKAKDLDMLRFRAPEAINSVIKSEAGKYRCAVVNADSAFQRYDDEKSNREKLFADHLHPSIKGYFLLSKLFYTSIQKENLINAEENKSVSKLSDRILRNTFPFTRLDSTFADIKLKILLNSYPFTRTKNTNSVKDNYSLENRADSTAMSVINGRISWDNAHYSLAEYYYTRGNYEGFFNEIMALIYDKPYDLYRYRAAAKYLTECGRYDLAYTVVSLLNRVRPSISSLKEMGSLSYKLGQFSRAVYFYNLVFASEKNDPQALLQAAKSYLKLGNGKAAEQLLKYSQSLNPESREIQNILDSLSHNNGS